MLLETNKPTSFREPSLYASQLPFISVIIPTLNEERYIGRCLESLTRQTYPKDRFEVLVIDGMSKDRTLKVVKRFKGRIRLRIFNNKKIRHVYAFNQGIRESRGDYFIILSGHSYVEDDFIEKKVETLFKVREKYPEVAAVGGTIEAVYEGRLSKILASIFLSPFSGSSNFWRSKNPTFAKTVPFALYDKEVVEEVGCFDEDMIKGNDLELNLRLVKNGYKLYYHPEIKSYYYTRSSLSKFLSQTFHNGAAKGLCIRKGYFHPLWFLPTLFLTYQVALLASFVKGLKTSIFLIPFLLYWVINVVVSLQLYKKVGKLVFILSALFWVMHNVIGFGFLMGLALGKKTFKLKG